MARRNLFQPPAPPAAAAPETKSRFPNTGAMNGVRSTLKDLSSNAVRDIAPEFIEESGPKDRLNFSDEDVAALAASIAQHGQQVPIMVRPIAEKAGYFRIVYGRRRLRALRSLGLPAKALVRSLSDAEAILAQGQENAQRLDPSFIEKALFAAELAERGYEQAVVLDALVIDKPMLSRMIKVAREIPVAVVQRIGSAHGIGRRRWEELADKARDHQLDLMNLADEAEIDAIGGSDERFAALANAVSAALAKPPAPLQIITHDDGTPLAELKDSARSLTLKFSKTLTPEFTQWLAENAQEELSQLFDTWRTKP